MNPLSLMYWPLRWVTRHIPSVLLIVLLSVSQVMSLIDARWHDALYGAVARVLPERWLTHSPKNLQRHKLAKARTIRTRILKRNVRNLSVNIGSIAAEAVPVIGVAAVAGVTLMDITDACNDARDLDRMLSSFSVGSDPEQEKICGMALPEAYREKAEKWQKKASDLFD